MPKTAKAKKKVAKTKAKPISKPKAKAKPISKPKIKVAVSKPKEINKGPIKISKSYEPKDNEKYMCEKHKVFFRMKLQEWKKELVRANNEALYNGSMDDNSISADIVDQASSYTDKNVEMKAINRQIKLISEIDKALLRIKDDTYGYCLDTAEPIGLKRLMARPVAKYTIAAQEKHEKNEKVHADD
jgi:DnaK suppressor protein